MPYIKHIVFDITVFLIRSLPVIIALIIISKLKVADETKKFKKCVFTLLYPQKLYSLLFLHY